MPNELETVTPPEHVPEDKHSALEAVEWLGHGWQRAAQQWFDVLNASRWPWQRSRRRLARIMVNRCDQRRKVVAGRWDRAAWPAECRRRWVGHRGFIAEIDLATIAGWAALAEYVDRNGCGCANAPRSK